MPKAMVADSLPALGRPGGPGLGDGWALCPGRPRLLAVCQDRLWTNITRQHPLPVCRKMKPVGITGYRFTFYPLLLFAGKYNLE